MSIEIRVGDTADIIVVDVFLGSHQKHLLSHTKGSFSDLLPFIGASSELDCIRDVCLSGYIGLSVLMRNNQDFFMELLSGICEYFENASKILIKLPYLVASPGRLARVLEKTMFQHRAIKSCQASTALKIKDGPKFAFGRGNDNFAVGIEFLTCHMTADEVCVVMDMTRCYHVESPVEPLIQSVLELPITYEEICFESKMDFLWTETLPKICSLSFLNKLSLGASDMEEIDIDDNNLFYMADFDAVTLVKAINPKSKKRKRICNVGINVPGLRSLKVLKFQNLGCTLGNLATIFEAMENNTSIEKFLIKNLFCTSNGATPLLKMILNLLKRNKKLTIIKLDFRIQPTPDYNAEHDDFDDVNQDDLYNILKKNNHTLSHLSMMFSDFAYGLQPKILECLALNYYGLATAAHGDTPCAKEEFQTALVNAAAKEDGNDNDNSNGNGGSHCMTQALFRLFRNQPQQVGIFL